MFAQTPRTLPSLRGLPPLRLNCPTQRRALCLELETLSLDLEVLLHPTDPVRLEGSELRPDRQLVRLALSVDSLDFVRELLLDPAKAADTAAHARPQSARPALISSTRTR